MLRLRPQLSCFGIMFGHQFPIMTLCLLMFVPAIGYFGDSSRDSEREYIYLSMNLLMSSLFFSSGG